MDKDQQTSSSPLSRIEHFTWAWFCLPMSTGALALLLSPQTQPHTFPGLLIIGKIVYIFTIILFTFVTMLIIYRFLRYKTLVASLTHPTESLFAATALLSIASLTAGLAHYAIPATGTWLVTAYRVIFWIYFTVSFIWAVFAYVLLFTSPALKISDMTPAWDLPIFPFFLSGTIASTGAKYQGADAGSMIIAGLTAQGLGFIMSILMYASYVRRMVQFGFPGAAARPAMFIAVGPPSFTALAILGMAESWQQYIGIEQKVLGDMLKVMATVVAIFIWSLSLWFFCIAVVACLLAAREMKFRLNWWAFVFPNVGFVIATISIGKALKSQGILWVGSVMTTGLVGVWLFVAVCHVRALWWKDILWPGKDEDVYTQVGQGKIEKMNEDVEKHD